MHGDIEPNPRPKPTTKNSKFCSCCHWNVNSLVAHNKLSVLEAFNITHKYDIICIAESCSDSIVALDGNALSK